MRWLRGPSGEKRWWGATSNLVGVAVVTCGRVKERATRKQNFKHLYFFSYFERLALYVHNDNTAIVHYDRFDLFIHFDQFKHVYLLNWPFEMISKSVLCTVDWDASSVKNRTLPTRHNF